MRAIADRVKAGGRAPQIDDREEEGAQHIHSKMRADPRQAERQGGRQRRGAARNHRGDEKDETETKTKTINNPGRFDASRKGDGQARRAEQRGDTQQGDRQGHCRLPSLAA